jgi:hypothetical protein
LGSIDEVTLFVEEDSVDELRLFVDELLSVGNIVVLDVVDTVDFVEVVCV